MALKLKLTASIYDQAQSDDRDPATVRYTRGDIFEARNQAEYDRLIDADAAVDPDKAIEQEQADLRARREALEAEQQRIDAALTDLSSDEPAPGSPEALSGKDLNDALDAYGLSKSGTVDEKRARLAEAQNAPG